MSGLSRSETRSLNHPRGGHKWGDRWGDEFYTTLYRHFKRKRSSFVNSNGLDATNYWIFKQDVTGFRDYTLDIYLTTSWSTETGLPITQDKTTDNIYESTVSGVLSYANSSHNSKMSPTSSLPVSLVGSDFTALNNKLLEKIDNQSIDMGTIVAEMGETLYYVASRGADIARFGLAVATGNWSAALRRIGISKRHWKRFNRVKRDTASRWLEFNFAIKPLVSDLSDIGQLYNEPDKVLRKIRCRAKVTRKETLEGIPVTWYGGEYKCTTDFMFSYAVTYSVSDPDTIALKALGLNNLPAAAWEVIPFSWLIDYVVNVGEFMQLCTATEGLLFRSGYKSMKASRVGKYEYLNDFTNTNVSPYHGSYSHEVDFRQGTDKTVGYRRDRLTSFPRPTLDFVLPEIRYKQISYVVALGTLLLGKK